MLFFTYRYFDIVIIPHAEDFYGEIWKGYTLFYEYSDDSAEKVGDHLMFWIDTFFAELE